MRDATARRKRWIGEFRTRSAALTDPPVGRYPHAMIPARAGATGLLATAWLLAASPAESQTARPIELQLKRWAETHADEQTATLERLVNIQSGTMNTAGVRAVGAAIRKSLDSLGFTTSWIDLPPELKRAGHLYAERKGGRASGSS